jgi:hypothetical protein
LLADCGLEPDPWQADLLRGSHERVLMLASRQTGKSLTAAALALKAALLSPPALVLLLSPTLRQSGELFRDKVCRLWARLGYPSRGKAPTRLELELSNGSRIVSLPENESGIRGYSGVGLLVIDEASRVSDELYYAVRPMLATSRGRLVALSTPFGQQGWFYQAWTGSEAWHRVTALAKDCARITPEFLAEERAALGSRWFSMEYECEFLGLAGAVFDPDDIDAAVTFAVEPVLLEGV